MCICIGKAKKRRDGVCMKNGWVGIRKIIIERDKCCMQCGSTNDLEVHHIIRQCDKGPEHPENLETLCRKCHDAKHASKPGLARITGEIDNSTLKRLRLYLIETAGSTQQMGPLLDEIINDALDKKNFPAVN